MKGEDTEATTEGDVDRGRGRGNAPSFFPSPLGAKEMDRATMHKIRDELEDRMSLGMQCFPSLPWAHFVEIVE
jgi:hypothetical protein